MDPADFELVTEGSLTGVSISSVAGSGTNYAVTVDSGAGYGTLQLKLSAQAEVLATTGITIKYDENSAVSGSLTIDPEPVLLALSRESAATTSAASVSFRAQFSEPVQGVDADSFEVLAAETVNKAEVLSVSQDGSDWIVEVGTGSGDGSLQLTLSPNHRIQDSVLQKLSNPSFASEVYQIDKEVPTVQQISRVDPSPSQAPTIRFEVRFSEPVTGVQLSDFSNSGTAAYTPSSVQCQSSVCTLSLQRSQQLTLGTVQLTLSDDDGIVDATGNPLAGASDGSSSSPIGYSIQPFQSGAPLETILSGITDVDYGDLDQDGDIDTVALDSHAGKVWILENINNKYMQPIELDPNYYQPTIVKVIDLNKDSRLDIVVGGGANNDIDSLLSVYFQITPMNFQKSVMDTHSRTIMSFCFVDFDQDGNQDIAISMTNQFEIPIYLNQGNKVFNKISAGPANAYTYLDCGDINGDSVPDIVTLDTANDELVYFDGGNNFSKALIKGSVTESDYAIKLHPLNKEDSHLDILLYLGGGAPRPLTTFKEITTVPSWNRRFFPELRSKTLNLLT